MELAGRDAGAPRIERIMGGFRRNLRMKLEGGARLSPARRPRNQTTPARWGQTRPDAPYRRPLAQGREGPKSSAQSLAGQCVESLGS